MPGTDKQVRNKRKATAECSSLEKADMRILYQVYQAYVEFHMPLLLSPYQWKRAAKLAEKGFLQNEGNLPTLGKGCAAYLITQAGINAYNMETKRQFTTGIKT